MAGGLGFEPRKTESESAVIPFHHPPTMQLKSLHNRSHFCKLRFRFRKLATGRHPYTTYIVPGPPPPKSFGTKGSQVQILPLRPEFLNFPRFTANDPANEWFGMWRRGHPLAITAEPVAWIFSQLVHLPSASCCPCCLPSTGNSWSGSCGSAATGSCHQPLARTAR